MWSPFLLFGQGPASSLDCPAMDILEFLSIGNKLQLLTLGGQGSLPPTSPWWSGALGKNRRLTFSNTNLVCKEFQERKPHTLQTWKVAKKHGGETG